MTMKYNKNLPKQNKDLETNGTHLQQKLQDVTYQQLVDVFGEPEKIDNPYKVRVQWTLETEKGVATIYDWKCNENYEPDYHIPLEQVTEWSLGGYHDGVVEQVLDALQS